MGVRSKPGDPVLLKKWQEAKKNHSRATSEYYKTKDDEREAYKAYALTTACGVCGRSPGSSVCGEADRILFACDNYVGEVH